MRTAVALVALAVLIVADVIAAIVGAFQCALWCVCGHPREMHQHDRAGTDCPKCDCNRFRAPPVWGRT